MANEVIQCLNTRRSVRKYKNDAIDESIIQSICEAGVMAPSGRNLQSPIIIAVSNKELRDRMSKLNAEVMGSDADPFYGAPVVLVVLANKDSSNYIYDGSCVMENLMLAAHSYGLGSCWIHRAKQVFDSEEGKAILKDLGIEGNYEGIGNCIIGYVDGDYPIPHPVKENRIYYVK